jgi:hypothetical protein
MKEIEGKATKKKKRGKEKSRSTSLKARGNFGKSTKMKGKDGKALGLKSEKKKSQIWAIDFDKGPKSSPSPMIKSAKDTHHQGPI